MDKEAKACHTWTETNKYMASLWRTMNVLHFPGGAGDKEPTCQCRLDVRDTGSSPELGRSLGGGHGNPLQYSCLENPRDRGAWWAAVLGSHRVSHDWATSLFIFMHWRRKWQLTLMFLPEESQGRGSLVGCRLGVAQSQTRLKQLSSSSSSSNHHLQWFWSPKN